jgi:hypothetical protein
VGSSRESLPVANGVQENLDSDADVVVWNQDIFKLSKTNIEVLVDAAGKYDFAAFVFNADDVAKIHRKKYSVTRDNVVFELGVFIGGLGRDRAFIITPSGKSGAVKLPSDLLGVTVATYNPNRQDDNLVAALGAPSNKIRRQMKELGGRKKLSPHPSPRRRAVNSSLAAPVAVATAPVRAVVPTDSMARKILATLWKYQQKHFGRNYAQRWTFAVLPGAREYAQYLSGLSLLVQGGLVVVDPTLQQCLLTDAGIHLCEAHDSVLAQEPTFVF